MPCIIGNLFDRGLTQGARTVLLPSILGQLDNAEQLITDSRHLAAEQAGKLIPTAELPHPTMHEPRDSTAAEQCGNADCRPQPRRCIKQPVERENDEKSN